MEPTPPAGQPEATTNVEAVRVETARVGAARIDGSDDEGLRPYFEQDGLARGPTKGRERR